MVETKSGTLLGKCAIDGQPIYDGSEDAAAEKAILLDRLEKYGWQTDPETGRLTKVLNRSEEME